MIGMETVSTVRPLMRMTALISLVVVASGCQVFQRATDLAEGGPHLSEIENPQQQSNYRPVSLPMPYPQPIEDNPNSLWRPGAKAFFKDIRAKEVGDTVTVHLRLDDSAKLENKTERNRNGGENADLNTILGYAPQLATIIPALNSGSTVLDITSDSQTTGDGGIDRSEEIELTLAALVTQVLPNGSLVIMGRQEIRVSNELRELRVRGVVRPQDIEADNTISHERIAEMRVAYGGRGMLSDLQQPRWGTQVLDIIFPF